MTNEDPCRLAKLVILFFQAFNDTRLDSEFQEEYGFDNMLRVRFTMEHKDMELPPKLGAALSKAVD